jgi:acyl carrier protein
MKSHVQVLVHRLFATHLRIDQITITDAKSFGELGVDALDLLFLVVRLEDLDPGRSEFPVDLLVKATTVGDFVGLVNFWLRDDESSDGARPTTPCDARI